MVQQLERAGRERSAAVGNQRSLAMCYEFESHYAKARIGEQLRKKAEEQKQRSESPAPAKPVEGEKHVRPQEPVPV
jgi:hypothetical protein